MICLYVFRLVSNFTSTIMIHASISCADLLMNMLLILLKLVFQNKILRNENPSILVFFNFWSIAHTFVGFLIFSVKKCIYIVFKKHRRYEAKRSKRTIKSAYREIFVYPERVFQANGNQSVSERRISKGELISATRCANPVRPSLLLWGARNARYPLFPPADCRLPRHVNVNVPSRANAGYFPGLFHLHVRVVSPNVYRKSHVRDSDSEFATERVNYLKYYRVPSPKRRSFQWESKRFFVTLLQLISRIFRDQ